MAAKFSLVVDAAGSPLLDQATGARFADMPVKVGKLTVTARKRIFTEPDQLGGLSDEDLLKMVNYAEDLFARAKATAANTPKGEKEVHRQQARKAWAEQDIERGEQTLITLLLTGPTQAQLNAKLDEYWDENLKPSSEGSGETA